MPSSVGGVVTSVKLSCMQRALAKGSTEFLSRVVVWWLGGGGGWVAVSFYRLRVLSGFWYLAGGQTQHVKFVSVYICTMCIYISDFVRQTIIASEEGAGGVGDGV